MADKQKLSALMRQGAKLHPQTCDGLFAVVDDATGQVIATCALGAVMLALDSTMNLKRCDVFYLERIIEEHTGVHIGNVRVNGKQLYHHIVHLNDGGESREVIADWLEAEGW
jgi:hypothetical protein